MSERNILIIAATILFVGLGVIVYIARSGGNGPSWKEHDARLTDLNSRMKQTLEKITSAHGAGKCTATSECRVVGLGQKTCGGYNNFLIYSTYDADETSLLDLVTRYNDIATEFNNLSMQVPNCGQQPAKILCQNSECVPR